MNPLFWATIAVAGVTLLGCAAPVLLLAFRVGKLTGQTEARMQAGESDRARIWESLGALGGKLDRHIETAHRVVR